MGRNVKFRARVVVPLKDHEFERTSITGYLFSGIRGPIAAKGTLQNTIRP